jgi:hypothetical protein
MKTTTTTLEYQVEAPALMMKRLVSPLSATGTPSQLFQKAGCLEEPLSDPDME